MSTTQNNGTVQLLSEIYMGSSGDIRLRMSPVQGSDRVSAFASCFA